MSSDAAFVCAKRLLAVALFSCPLLATELASAQTTTATPADTVPEPVPETPPAVPETPPAVPETPPVAPPAQRPDAPKADAKAEKPGLVHYGKSGLVVAGVSVNGRFDVAYEFNKFALDTAEDIESGVRNYHHFLFVSRNQPDEWFSFTAELIDLSFYEVGLKVSDEFQLRFGKIMVPFGSDPLFHHNYGGLSGFEQKLLPFVWAEHGAVFEANLYRKKLFSIDNELYAVAGIAGDTNQVLQLNGTGDPTTVAIGDRIRVGYDKYSAAFSIYYDQYDSGEELYLWGFDVSAGYGFLPWPVVDRLSLSAGFLRADVRSAPLGDYYHFGDYVQLDCRLPWTSGFRYRTGMITMENHQGVAFDDRDERKGADDTLAHSFSLWKRYRGLTVSAQFIINIEAAGEIDNDLLRFSAALDF